MLAFQFVDSNFPIRSDLQLAYRDYWSALAEPGTWWTGAQRVALANEVRKAVSCPFCAQRRQALSPYSVPGKHLSCVDSDGVISAAAIDAVHRVITDQSRITKSYIDDNNSSGLSVVAFVELIGVAVTVFSIDESMRALGLALEPLPLGKEGEPSHYSPQGLATHTGVVPMITAGAIGESESDLWSVGRSANVLRALSAVPNAVREWMRVADAQYLAPEQMMTMLAGTHRAINRMQMELVAGRVSSHNECFY